MSRKRIFEDHTLSNLENQHRVQDRASSIDDQLDVAMTMIDWQRRNKASASFIDFIQTYCIGLMIDDKPSDTFIDALKEMEFALS